MRLSLVCIALVFPLAVSSQQGTVTPRVVEAANAFLATLSAPEKAKVTFGFTSSQRTGWSNLPSGIFQRNGLRFGDLTQQQRDAALNLVAAALEPRWLQESHRHHERRRSSEEHRRRAEPVAGREARWTVRGRGPVALVEAVAFASDATNTTSRSSELPPPPLLG